jgi:hypothetical protein
MVFSEPKFFLLRKTSRTKNGKERVLESFVFRNAMQFYSSLTQESYKKSIRYVEYSCTQSGTVGARKWPSCLCDLGGSF